MQRLISFLSGIGSNQLHQNLPLYHDLWPWFCDWFSGLQRIAADYSMLWGWPCFQVRISSKFLWKRSDNFENIHFLCWNNQSVLLTIFQVGLFPGETFDSAGSWWWKSTGHQWLSIWPTCCHRSKLHSSFLLRNRTKPIKIIILVPD